MEKWNEWERRVTLVVLILMAFILCYKLTEASQLQSPEAVQIREMQNDIRWLKSWIQESQKK